MSFYETKEKAKVALEKVGVIKLANLGWATTRYFRHLECQFMAFLRSHGFKDRRYIPLKSFENIHVGERCFIVCTGPSLRLEDLNRLKNEYSFSMNTIIKLFSETDWRPTYYVIQDSNAYQQLKDKIHKADLPTKMACDWILKEHGKMEDMVYFPFDFLNHYSLTPEKWKKNNKYKFSGDAYAMIYDGQTVTYAAMQFAVYMGFKEIFLLGCDCDFQGEKKYIDKAAYTSANPTSNFLTSYMLSAYKTAKRYADAHGIRIYNATRGGKLEVFERVNFDELMGKKDAGK